MSHTATLTEGINAAGVIVTKSFAYTSEGLEAVNVDVPDSTTDKQVLVNIDVSALKVLYINSTQDLLMEWNDNIGSQGSINLKYHFDADMDTHVIDSLNGAANWWYDVWYDGGWTEQSIHRMDYYPVKDKMTITFLPVSAEQMGARYDAWRAQTARKKSNDGKVIIPTVQIMRERSQDDLFVQDTPHDPRVRRRKDPGIARHGVRRQRPPRRRRLFLHPRRQARRWIVRPVHRPRDLQVRHAGSRAPLYERFSRGSRTGDHGTGEAHRDHLARRSYRPRRRRDAVYRGAPADL